MPKVPSAIMSYDVRPIPENERKPKKAKKAKKRKKRAIKKVRVE